MEEGKGQGIHVASETIVDFESMHASELGDGNGNGNGGRGDWRCNVTA